VREGHSIADAVQLGLIRELPDIIDVVVHVDPPESAK